MEERGEQDDGGHNFTTAILSASNVHWKESITFIVESVLSRYIRYIYTFFGYKLVFADGPREKAFLSLQKNLIFRVSCKLFLSISQACLLFIPLFNSASLIPSLTPKLIIIIITRRFFFFLLFPIKFKYFFSKTNVITKYSSGIQINPTPLPPKIFDYTATHQPSEKKKKGASNTRESRDEGAAREIGRSKRKRERERLVLRFCVIACRAATRLILVPEASPRYGWRAVR